MELIRFQSVLALVSVGLVSVVLGLISVGLGLVLMKR